MVRSESNIMADRIQELVSVPIYSILQLLKLLLINCNVSAFLKFILFFCVQIRKQSVAALIVGLPSNSRQKQPVKNPDVTFYLICSFNILYSLGSYSLSLTVFFISVRLPKWRSLSMNFLRQGN